MKNQPQVHRFNIGKLKKVSFVQKNYRKFANLVGGKLKKSSVKYFTEDSQI